MQELLKYAIFFIALMIFFIARENVRFNKAEKQTREHVQARDSLTEMTNMELYLKELNQNRLNNLSDTVR